MSVSHSLSLTRQALFARLLLTLVSAGAASDAVSEPTAFVNDKSHQYVGFEVSHFGFSPVRGRFEVVDVTLSIDEATPADSRVSVVIDATSIDSDHEARDAHLMGADFFDVATYPTLRFESDAIAFDTPTTGRVTGDLTMLGVARPVALDFELTRDAPFPLPGYHNVRTLGFVARGVIRRTEWGMDAYVGEAIGDEVALTIQFDAVQCDGAAIEAPSCAYGR